jgi:[acyl-carrier-protein] S-malonyltransferase
MTKTALLFAGQGAQVVGMGRDLAAHDPVAARIFDLADRILGYPLSKLCFEGPIDELTKTEHAQPAIFVMSMVAFELLQTRVPAFRAEAMAGLSLGEFTALTAAGVMTLEDGLRVVRQRGQFMQQACEITQGGMAAVIGLDETLTRAACEETGVELANLNCPGQIVISGESVQLEKAIAAAQAKGARRALPLPVAGAYHSRLMASAQPKLHAVLASTPIELPMVPVISNVTAQPHAAPADIHRRLVDQVTSPVRWEESMQYLLGSGFTRFIELGPGTALSGFMKRIDKNATMLNIGDVASLEATVSALQS